MSKSRDRTFVAPSGAIARREGVSESTARKLARRGWKERGHSDGCAGRPRLSRARLLELGGQDALSAYFQGWRVSGRPM